MRKTRVEQKEVKKDKNSTLKNNKTKKGKLMFEKTMDFSEALKNLKAGKKLTRKGWNGNIVVPSN